VSDLLNEFRTYIYPANICRGTEENDEEILIRDSRSAISESDLGF
jgi:hypothetical protein